jgi:ADP-heptose:LPS heptosyltransferase/glycosyltransferase involved in cell wall biosynthesis
MKVRYRGSGVKICKHHGKNYEIPSDTWVDLNNLTLFKKLKTHPDVFDTVSYFDIKPFELLEDLIEFKGNLIFTGDALAIRSLDKIPFVRKQAVKPEEHTHIYRIVNYDNENLSRFSDVNRTVNCLIFRRLGGIGDILMTSPIIEAACKRYPHFKITYSCPAEFLPLMENNPFIHNLKPFREDVASKNWDVVTDLTRDCIKYEIAQQPEVKKNRTEVFIEKCGLNIDEIPRPKVFLSDDEILNAKKEINEFKELKVGLVLKSNAPVRNWPYFYDLRQRLLNEYPQCGILEFCKYRPKQWQSHPQVYPVFERDIRDVAALINECDLVISPDTGLAHISSSLRVPTIWIFTHINGQVRTKNYDNVWVVQKIAEDCPKGTQCWYEIPCSGGEVRGELIVDPPCSVTVSVDDVFAKVKEVLKRPNLSYVVVYKDLPEITSQCVNLIKENKKWNDEVVLVDNGSQVNCQFEDLKKGIRCIRNGENLGCILGRNQGMKESKGRFILTLDNDQYIVPKTMHALMNTEGDVTGVEGWSMDKGGWAFDIKDKRGQLAYVGGGGMLVKKKVAEEVDYLSEEFAPAWFSDPDFCFKAVVKGFKVGLCDLSGIKHLKHKTIFTQTDFDHQEAWKRSHQIFKKKWGVFLRKTNRDSELGVEKLMEWWGGFNRESLMRVLESETPLVTFLGLSWLRYEKLVTCLKNNAKNTKIKNRLLLQVQGSELLSDEKKKNILELSKKIDADCEVFFTEGNKGTAAPRKWIVDYFFKKNPTKYVVMLDDDTTFPEYGIVAAISILEDHPKLGALGLYHKNIGYVIDHYTKVEGGKVKNLRLNYGLNSVDILGSGHSVIKSEALKETQIDEEYFVGLWDWDMFMQMRKAGWKFKTLMVPPLIVMNDKGGSKEYKKARRSGVERNIIIPHFKKKWNLAS